MPSTEAPALDQPAIEYRSLVPPRRRIFSWPVFIVSAGIVAVLFGVFALVMPKLLSIYADFGMYVGGITQRIFDVSLFMRWRGLLWSTSIPPALGFLVPFALQRRVKPVSRTQKWIMALLISNILLAVALLLVIFVWVIPMYGMFSGFFVK